MSSSPIGAGGATAAEIGNEYDTRVAKLALDQQSQEGQNAVALIESAAQSQTPASPDGKGRLINTYA